MSYLFSPGATTQRPSKPSPLAQTSFPHYSSPLRPTTSFTHQPLFSSSSLSAPDVPPAPGKTQVRRQYARSNRARGHLDRAQSSSRPPYSYEYRDRHPAQEEPEDEDDPGRMIELALRPKPTLGGFLDPLNGKISGRVKKKPLVPLIRTAIENSFQTQKRFKEPVPTPTTPPDRFKISHGGRPQTVPGGGGDRIPAGTGASTSSISTLPRIRGSSPVKAKPIYVYKPRRKPTHGQFDDINPTSSKGFPSRSALVDKQTTPAVSTSKKDPFTVLAEARRTAHRMLGPIPPINEKTGREGPLSIPDTYYVASTHTRTTGNDSNVNPTYGTTLNDNSVRTSTCTRGSIRGPIDDPHRPARKIYKLPRRIKGSSSASAPASLGIIREGWGGEQGGPGTHQEKENTTEHPTADGQYSTFCSTGLSNGPDDLLEDSKERKGGWRTISEMTADLWETSTSRLDFLSGEKDVGEPKVIWSRRSKEGDGTWEVKDYEMEEMLDEGIQDEGMQDEEMEVYGLAADDLAMELETEAEFPAAWGREDDLSHPDQNEDPADIPIAELDDNPRKIESIQGSSDTVRQEEADDMENIPKIASQRFELNGYWRRVEGKWVLVPKPARNSPSRPREPSPIPRFEEVEAI